MVCQEIMRLLRVLETLDQSVEKSICQSRSAGDLERLRRFWLTGTCNPKKEEKKASEPLSHEQFLSAFWLLVCGIFLATALMALEHTYVRWIKTRVAKSDKAGCCALISTVSRNGMTMTGAIAKEQRQKPGSRAWASP